LPQIPAQELCVPITAGTPFSEERHALDTRDQSHLVARRRDRVLEPADGRLERRAVEIGRSIAIGIRKVGGRSPRTRRIAMGIATSFSKLASRRLARTVDEPASFRRYPPNARRLPANFRRLPANARD
jgi:hypothetical protein